MNKVVGTSSTYTAATRILSGCGSMTPAQFDQSDIGRTVVMTDGEAGYFGRIKRVISNSSVEFHEGANLITSNWTFDPAAVIMLDQGEAHTFADYIARIRTLVQDNIDKLSDDEYKRLLGAAVTDYGEDKPQTASFKVQGNGTNLYSMATILGSYWQYGTVYIERIEFPIGTYPPTLVNINNVLLYDDGTAQDGSNVKLMLVDVAPATTEYFIVTVRYMPRLPEVGTPTLAATDTNFNNVTLLATAYACFALASAYALSTDSTITGDVVNYADKTDKYLRLGRTYLERYNISVFGSENPPSTAAAATVTLNLERRATDRGSFLFH